MHPAVPQIMLGILLIVVGVVIVKGLMNEWGWAVFLLGVTLGCKGGIELSQSGMKELGNSAAGPTSRGPPASRAPPLSS